MTCGQSGHNNFTRSNKFKRAVTKISGGRCFMALPFMKHRKTIRNPFFLYVHAKICRIFRKIPATELATETETKIAGPINPRIPVPNQHRP